MNIVSPPVNSKPVMPCAIGGTQLELVVQKPKGVKTIAPELLEAVRKAILRRINRTDSGYLEQEGDRISDDDYLSARLLHLALACGRHEQTRPYRQRLAPLKILTRKIPI